MDRCKPQWKQDGYSYPNQMTLCLIHVTYAHIDISLRLALSILHVI